MARTDAELLAAAATATGLSQRALAEALGVPQSTLYRVLHRGAALGVPVRRLARLLAHDPSLVLQLADD